MRSCVTLALLISAFLAPAFVRADTPTTRVHDNATGDDVLISCQPGPLKSDYRAETASSLPPSDPYAVARGVDHGLVRLMFEDARRVKQFVIPGRSIRSMVTVKLDQVLPDKVDILYLPSHVMVIHTSTSNAGIFTDSDVYRLTFDASGRVERQTLKDSPDVLQSLDLGLSFYQAHLSRCRSGHSTDRALPRVQP
jgi:hypothetical protein